MHPLILLHRWLESTCPFMHRRRLQALLLGVGALLAGQRLTLSDLGRHVPGRGSPRHDIKRIDRLLGNRHLHVERPVVYQALAAWTLSAHRRPVLLVDWSDLAAIAGRRRHLVIKAALSYRGRAVTIYEEVHPLRSYNTPRVHRLFLRRLATIVPPHCHPIVVSDAGFRGPWFKAVEALGWDWVGRVRDAVRYSADEGHSWPLTTELYRRATPTLRTLGRCRVARRYPYEATLFLIRKYRPRGAGRPKRSHGHRYNAQVGRKRHKEPWLLATSLQPSLGLGKKIVALYSRRMQIEHTFRDDKSIRWGWQLDCSGTRTLGRLQVLLLIASLATFVSWLAGLAAESRGLLSRVQVGSRNTRRSLSTVFVGRYLLRRQPRWLDEKALLESVLAFPDILARPPDFVGIP